jgi:hypothetical protein
MAKVKLSDEARNAVFGGSRQGHPVAARRTAHLELEAEGLVNCHGHLTEKGRKLQAEMLDQEFNR